jgi:ring-1,2-phenylacetyl-CoA epoxidase subunit PaaC
VETADLVSADLVSADLVSADLEAADLVSADLEAADLEAADLEAADLEAADLKTADIVDYTLRLADDALVLAQRTGEWIAAAPQLEEDMALANIALDLLGQARGLLSYAGATEGAGRDEDALAYLRDERDFTNAQLVELPNGDFGRTIARLLVFSAYQVELHTQLAESADPTLAAVAAKAVKEVYYHRDHAAQWTLRLGDGTDESRSRMQAGLDDVWPYVDELFADDELTSRLAADGVAVLPSRLRAGFDGFMAPLVERATLSVPQSRVRHTGGRSGVHTEHMGHLLAQMQYLARSHAGATW